VSEVEWARLKAEEIEALAGRDAVVIVPVGSLEQHGRHLPTGTDSLLVAEVARRAAVLAAGRHPVVVTPCVWTGLSEHHMELGGTVTLDFGTFAAILRGIAESLVRQGFERICLLNGHGGNVAALKTITDELTFDLEVPVVSGTYWQVAAAAVEPLLERQKSIRHACEAETSMIMAVAPELVDAGELAAADRPDARDAGTADDPLYRWRGFAEKTGSGALGIASAGTAAKGEAMLNEAARVLADRLVDAALWAPAGRAR
jgi:creatinine amidohydrolase